jgi:hypothetical protein
MDFQKTLSKVGQKIDQGIDKGRKAKVVPRARKGIAGFLERIAGLVKPSTVDGVELD